MSSTGKDGLVTLGGREFKRVKNGVDEAQVGAFIDELIKERDELAQARHHMASLTKLAETTIVEAERMAERIKSEASERAKAESDALLDEARQQSRQMAEQRQAEALEAAGKEAADIRSEAKREAATLLKRERERIWDELRGTIGQQFGFLTGQLEGLRQQAAKAQADFESRVAQTAQESAPVMPESGHPENAATSQVAQESDDTLMSVEEQPKDGKEDSEEAAVEDNKTPAESAKQEGVDDRSERGFDLSRLLQMDDWAESTEPQFEVEILPPIQMTKIMEIVAYLDQLPEVQNTEIIPRMESPSIMVFLRDEIDLIDALKTIPAVAYVEEATIDADAGNGESGQAPRKIRIGLSEKAMPQERR
ncbi:MAG: hypothetical protein ACNA7X_01460 [Dehalococcoidia bacterium]